MSDRALAQRGRAGFRCERRETSSPTSLVLSMAFKMATFSFSRAARTLTYSPRYGPKYSGRKGEFVLNWYRTDVAGGVSDSPVPAKVHTRELVDVQVAERQGTSDRHHLSIALKINVNRAFIGNILSAALVKLTDLTIISDFTGVQGAVNQIRGGLFFQTCGHDLQRRVGGSTDGGRGELTWCAACRWSNTALASAPLSGCHRWSTTGTRPRTASRRLWGEVKKKSRLTEALAPERGYATAWHDRATN